MSHNPDFLNPSSEAEADTPPGAEETATPPPESEAAVPATKPAITFQGNSYDLASVVGVTIGGVVLLTCATCNFGFYCLPVFPIILGIVGLVSAKEAVEPERTKLLSWISIGSGAAILLLLFLIIVLYVGFIVFAIASEGNF